MPSREANFVSTFYDVRVLHKTVRKSSSMEHQHKLRSNLPSQELVSLPPPPPPPPPPPQQQQQHPMQSQSSEDDSFPFYRLDIGRKTRQQRRSKRLFECQVLQQQQEQEQQQPLPLQAALQLHRQGSSSPEEMVQQHFHSAESSKRRRKYVGVRQRSSGRWVAEIKDSAQKVRLWLGTYDNAEDAARAYDEAAHLLRGASTRSNFASAASSLPEEELHYHSPEIAEALSIFNNHSFDYNCGEQQHLVSPVTAPVTTTRIPELLVPSNSSTSSAAFVEDSSSIVIVPREELIPNPLPPDVVAAAACFPGFFSVPPPEEGGSLVSKNTTEDDAMIQIRRRKYERQSSASLYAMIGAHELQASLAGNSAAAESGTRMDTTWSMTENSSLSSLFATLPDEAEELVVRHDLIPEDNLWEF